MRLKNRDKVDPKNVKEKAMVYLKETPQYGGDMKQYGVFASRDLKPDEIIPGVFFFRNKKCIQDRNSLIDPKPTSSNKSVKDGDEPRMDVVDGPLYFLNHDYKPNCTTRVKHTAGNPSHRSDLKVTKLIKKDEELTINYGKWYDFQTDDGCPCGSCKQVRAKNLEREMRLAGRW